MRKAHVAREEYNIRTGKNTFLRVILP